MMHQEILDSIDSFMDAKSSDEMPEDNSIRQKLYEALVNNVSESWKNYMTFYQKKFNTLSTEYDRGRLNSKASVLQELCVRVVGDLEEVERRNCTPEALFHTKELTLYFKNSIEEFKKQVEKEFKETTTSV